MAEVRLRIGQGAYRILKTTYNQSPISIESKQGKSAIQAVVLQTERRSNEAQHVHETVWWGHNSTPSQAPGILQEGLGSQTSRSCSKLADSVNELAIQCREDEIKIGLTCRNTLSNRSDTTLCDGRGMRWFYVGAPHLADARVHVIAGASSWRRTGVMPTTGTTYDWLRRREQRRTLCTVRFANRQPSLTGRLRQSHKHLSSTRAYGGNSNTHEPLYKSKTGYYDILEVSPSATHAQIKTAYYKQSFVYHPDKNAGTEEATSRFSDISEAYNVLGNKALRKKYDRGILSHGDLTGASRPSAKDAASSSTAQPTRARHSPMAGMDSKNVFNFDQFIKSHYGGQLQREMELRTRKEEMLRKKEAGIKDKELGRMKEAMVGLLVAMTVVILLSLRGAGD